MNGFEEGFVTVKQTVEEMALSRFGRRFFKLAPFQADRYGALIQLRLISGEKINLKLSCHELSFYPIDSATKKVVDDWVRKRLKVTDYPDLCR